MFIPTLETERLILRRIEEKDADGVFAWTGDPRVTKYMMYSTYKNVEDVKKWISTLYKDELSSYEFLIVEKSTKEIIEACGIGYHKKDNVWEFGYNLRYISWGKGYATEATKRIIRFAYDTLGARDFQSCHAIDNPDSGKVITKCGLLYHHDSQYLKFDGSESFKSHVYFLHID